MRKPITPQEERKSIEVIASCINDDKPQFEVKMWIEKGKLYKANMSTITEDTIDGSIAFEWIDEYGNPIIPNEQLECRHIKENRFEPILVAFLN